MATKDEIKVEFIDRIAVTHDQPKRDFSKKLAEMFPRATVEQLHTAAEIIVRTKNIKTFPSLAVCAKIIQDAAPRPASVWNGAGPDKSEPYLDKARLHMARCGRHADGSYGVVLSPSSPSWSAWKEYFAANGIRLCLHRMEHLERSGDTCRYMVPSEWPSEFDASAPPPSARSDAGVDSTEITL